MGYTRHAPPFLPYPPRRLMRNWPSRLLRSNPYLLLALAGLCWSGNHVIGRAVAGQVPPIGLSLMRWLLPALILWPLARPYVLEDWPKIVSHWRVIVLLAFLGGTLFGILQYIGLNYTTALNVSVINSTAPVMIFVAGALLFADRLGALQMGGIGTSLIGVIVIVSRGQLEVLRSLQFNIGDLIILFNQFIWAVYSACLRLRPPLHWMSFTFILSIVASVATLPLYVWEHASGNTFHATWTTMLAVGYVAIFPSVVAFASWNRGVEMIGANRAGAFLHLIPLYSAILASTFLGEELMLYHVLGFALILAGVWLAARKSGKDTGASA